MLRTMKFTKNNGRFKVKGQICTPNIILRTYFSCKINWVSFHIKKVISLSSKEMKTRSREKVKLKTLFASVNFILLSCPFPQYFFSYRTHGKNNILIKFLSMRAHAEKPLVAGKCTHVFIPYTSQELINLRISFLRILALIMWSGFFQTHHTITGFVGEKFSYML